MKEKLSGSMPPVLFIFLCLMTPFLPARAGEISTIPSALKSATVYRSGAELVHTATASLEQGNNELIIGNISNAVDINSIQVGCNGSVTIMSVEFSKEFLKPESKSPLLRRLDDSLGTIKQEQ